MRHPPLTAKANIAFVFCFFCLVILSAMLYIYGNELNIYKFKSEQERFVNQLSSLYQNRASLDEIYLENNSFHEVNDKHLKDAILKQNADISEQNMTFGYLSAFIYKNRYYIKLTDKEKSTLFESKETVNDNKALFIAFLALCALFIWFYLSIVKEIKTAEELTKAVRKFTFESANNEQSGDIGELIKEFNRSAESIANLSKLRTLFTRAIMHELKTPIGKGRIISEMIEEGVNKERLIKLFRRLDGLVNEFGKIEQFVMQNYKTDTKRYSIKDILNASFDILMLEPEQFEKIAEIKLPKKNVYISADFNSMSLAFKNLIDNAIKYGSDKRVIITLEKNRLSFCNKGEPLKELLTEDREPFVSFSKAKTSGGMGLGLYIVDSIFRLHGLKLNYEYKNGCHCFFVDLITL